jgi:hypothetical protein
MAMRTSYRESSLRDAAVTQIYGKGSTMSKKEDKNTEPSPPQQVTDDGEIVPVLDGVPEDDSAEPEDAEVEHLADEDEVEGS